LPCKANSIVQREFVNNTLLPLIEKAKEGVIELFFMDASHFLLWEVLQDEFGQWLESM
jgi:hypothetical protein